MPQGEWLSPERGWGWGLYLQGGPVSRGPWDEQPTPSVGTQAGSAHLPQTECPVQLLGLSSADTCQT